MSTTKVKGFYIDGEYYEFIGHQSGGGGGGGGEPTGTTLYIPDLSTVIETAMNYILKLENGNLMLSTDLGKTWTTKENTYGTITHAHFFGDGTLMFCTPTAAYYTKDLVTITQATILDIDGSAWSPSGHHFFVQQKFDTVEVINGVEIHYWGDYYLSGATNLWYTVDNGHTIKAAFKFGTSQIDGTTISARHCHQFVYNKYDGHFYVTTGDTLTENNLIRGDYNPQNDTWTWELLAQGADYKFGMILFDRNFIYGVTDYAGSGQTFTHNMGILKCPMDKLGTPDAWTLAWDSGRSPGGAGLVSLLIDGCGNKLLTIDSENPGYVYLATKGLDFKLMTLAVNQQLGIRFTGPNYNGDYYATFKNFGGYDGLCLNFYPTINVKKMMELNGYEWNKVIPFDKECSI